MALAVIDSHRRGRDMKVFLSATVRDLEEYRAAAIEQLRRMQADFEHIDMRYFPNSEADPTTLSLDELDTSDIYLGIIGHRYGTLSPDGRTSITRAEYDRAYLMKKKLVIYLADEWDVRLPEPLREDEKCNARQKEFRRILTTRHTPKRFHSPEELASMIAYDIPAAIRDLQPALAYRIFHADLADVRESLDRRLEKFSRIEDFLTTVAESFKTLFALDRQKLDMHPFFYSVRNQLEAVIPGLTLSEVDGRIERTGVRHAVLRTDTVIRLIRDLDAAALRRIGTDIGRGAARDLVERTLRAGAYVPASPEAFVALWNYWDRTGGWGTYQLLEDAAEGNPIEKGDAEWHLRVANNFLAEGTTEETHHLCNFWCGYIHGFLDEALPDISEMMMELPATLRGEEITMPAYNSIVSVEHVADDEPDSDLFRIVFRPSECADSLVRLARSKFFLRRQDYDTSMVLSSAALEPLLHRFGDSFKRRVDTLSLEEAQRATLDRIIGKIDTAVTRENAESRFEVVNQVVQELCREQTAERRPSNREQNHSVS
jgi:hypothetical protein